MADGDGQVVATAQPTDASLAATAQEGKAVEEGKVEPVASTAQPDWEAEAKKWEASSKRHEQRASTLQGSVKKQAEQEALVLRLGEQFDALVEHLTSEDADPNVLKAKLAGVKTKETAALLASRDKVISGRWKNEIIAALGALQISPEDKRVEPALDLWSEGMGADDNPTDMDKLYEARMFVKDLETDTKVALANKKTEAAEAKAKEAEARFKIDGGLLSGANPRGTPTGGFGKDAYIQALKDGKAMPSPAEIDRLTASYTRG